MTVAYNLDVSSVGSFTFLKLLGRWKGSIFKSVYLELVLWTIIYYIISLIYRYALTQEQQKLFEFLSINLDNQLVKIPLTFMLGFFVSVVIDRWRNILANISFIETCALTVSSLVRGHCEEARLIRRNIIRYLVLSQVMLFRDISMRVRRRFPNLESLIDAGFLFEEELNLIKDFKFDYNKYWIPINWANTLVCRATYAEGDNKTFVDSCPTMNHILNTIKEYRVTLDHICKYDWVPIPIAYPQVVFLAVRVYFVICLISRQFILHENRDDEKKNLIFPIMTILEFIFFVGWMKVAEALLNPLGEDDDDLECNWLIDKNIATGMAIVDSHHDQCPKVRLDLFADPSWKPVYSEESILEVPVNRGGSAANVELPGANERVRMVAVDIINDPIHKKSDTGDVLRRKITNALNYHPKSHSIQPMNFLNVDTKKLSTASRESAESSRSPNATHFSGPQFVGLPHLTRLDEELVENENVSTKEEGKEK